MLVKAVIKRKYKEAKTEREKQILGNAYADIILKTITDTTLSRQLRSILTFNNLLSNLDRNLRNIVMTKIYDQMMNAKQISLIDPKDPEFKALIELIVMLLSVGDEEEDYAGVVVSKIERDKEKILELYLKASEEEKKKLIESLLTTVGKASLKVHSYLLVGFGGADNPDDNDKIKEKRIDMTGLSPKFSQNYPKKTLCLAPPHHLTPKYLLPNISLSRSVPKTPIQKKFIISPFHR